jgi:hypothetical protein
MMSECWSFFFSFLFGALCQRGRKLEGSTTFRCHGEVATAGASCSYLLRVVFARLWVWESFKTLFV